MPASRGSCGRRWTGTRRPSGGTWYPLAGSLQVVVLGPVVGDGGPAVLELERNVEQVGHGAAHGLPRIGLHVEDEEPSPAGAQQLAAEGPCVHAALVQGVDGAS